jgi:hypothetical protein
MKNTSAAKPLSLMDKKKDCGQTEVSEHIILHCCSKAYIYKIPSATAFMAKPPNPTKTNDGMDAFCRTKGL